MEKYKRKKKKISVDTRHINIPLKSRCSMKEFHGSNLYTMIPIR